jgi:hypothetical protein
MNTVTTDLPAWVAATCPSWCQHEHKVEHLWSNDSELHIRRFGPGDDEWVSVSVEIRQDGTVRHFDGTVEGFDVEEPGAADALDDAAAVLREAAAWVRATVLPMLDASQ